jgi:Zn finger protein HypA/HybF involved in hydrogenase expression
MLDVAKGLKDMNDAAVRNAAVIELQEKIFAAQSQQKALIERVRELEKRVTEFETWESEKQRYQLTDFGGGTFAYVLKPEMSGTEPPHRICAACYQKGHKSVLQRKRENSLGQERYACPECKVDFHFGDRDRKQTIEPSRTGSLMSKY